MNRMNVGKDNIKHIVKKLKGIKNINEEANLSVKNDGIYMTAMEPSATMFYRFVLNKEMFEEFAFENEQSIRVKITEMINVLNRFNSGASMKFYDDYCLVENISGKRKSMTITYYEYEESKEIDLFKDTSVETSVPSVDLDEAFKDMSIFEGSSIVFEFKNGMFNLYNRNKLSSDVYSNVADEIESVNDMDIKSCFDIELLKKAINSKEDKTLIKMDDRGLLIVGHENEMYSFRCVIAPREMEDDTE